MPYKTAEERRAHDLRYLYAMSVEDWDAMFVAQGGCCALCYGDASTSRGGRLFVDHDHACCPGRRSCGACVRGLICTSCNMAVSRQDLDPNFALRLFEYTRKV